MPGPVVVPLGGGHQRAAADGAQLIRDAHDVLDSLLGVGRRDAAGAAPGPPLDEAAARAVLERGRAGGGDAADARRGRRSSSRVEAAVGARPARAAGYVARDAAGRYRAHAAAAASALS